MNKSIVALVGCDSYDEVRVGEAVKEGLDLLGGMSSFVKPAESIVLKPNVLFGADPRRCIGTHPSVLKAAGRELQQAGATALYGDSPGFGGCQANMKRARLKDAADALGMAMADFDRGRVTTHREALLNRRFVIANGILDSDGVISLPKLKTHGLTRFTGAVKNQFGCVPGMQKGQFHVKLADPQDFATMLVDLTALIMPRLYIMDGIMAMEGNGPRSGRPRKLGILLFSTDPVALDAVACRIIGLNAEFVPTAAPGERAGLGTYHHENIEVIGDNPTSFVDEDFDVVRRPPVSVTSGAMRTFLKNQICPRPVIDEAICTNCGTCVKFCSVNPKAVDWRPGAEARPPKYNYDRCIRCFCCQEFCPEGAISIRNSLLGNQAPCKLPLVSNIPG
jgi:uncharacterized protein (DUF362 family)/Pyruvate/2-oxoacid:ferredoxin oxidoreductase delta subunit